jgi:hypothetical protein
MSNDVNRVLFVSRDATQLHKELCRTLSWWIHRKPTRPTRLQYQRSNLIVLFGWQRCPALLQSFAMCSYILQNIGWHFFWSLMIVSAHHTHTSIFLWCIAELVYPTSPHRKSVSWTKAWRSSSITSPWMKLNVLVSRSDPHNIPQLPKSRKLRNTIARCNLIRV